MCRDFIKCASISAILLVVPRFLSEIGLKQCDYYIINALTDGNLIIQAVDTKNVPMLVVYGIQLAAVTGISLLIIKGRFGRRGR